MGHEEIEGTAGEAPDHIQVIAGAEEDRGAAHPPTPSASPYLTQTTLAVDETADVGRCPLRERPSRRCSGPASDDICYATQNRQDAVRALARGLPT